MISFGNWLKSKDIPIKAVQNHHVNEFLAALCPPRLELSSRQKTGARKAVSLILKTHSPKRSAFQREADRFQQHLHINRGLCEKRCVTYAKYVKQFLAFSFPNKRVYVKALQPCHVKKFIESIPATKANSARQYACSALRAYFEFLELNGKRTGQIAAAIPILSSHRRNLPQRIVDPISLNTLLKAINKSTKIGKRDYAALLCLVDLAMRVGDVANLTLDDINWREGTIKIRGGKTGTPFIMPIPQRVGDAIVDYIKNARPETKHRNLFMNHKLCADDTPASDGTLKASIQKLWAVSGLSDKFSGTHILRHSTATMLRQKGIPLKIIADFLGHNSIEITKCYAQVDIDALRQVVQPWPTYGGAK
jgi:site-specific recombinase XerD